MGPAAPMPSRLLRRKQRPPTQPTERITVRLLKLRLINFRRFAGDNSFDLDESLIAVVGPNEAGKSSLLDALEQVGRQASPQPTDSARGHDDPADVRALYRIEAEDREGLDTPWADELRLVWVHRQSDNEKTTWRFEPRPTRDLQPRADVLTELRQVLDAVEEEAPEGWDADLASEVLNLLGTEDETLSGEHLE